MLAECKLYSGQRRRATAANASLRFMAASKVLGEETVSGVNGTVPQNAGGKTNEK